MDNWPTARYGAILADPPWKYTLGGESLALQGTAIEQYPTMDLPSIKALPVGDLAAPNCALFLWATMPLLPEALETIAAWGFRYKTVAFCWAKESPSRSGWHLGLGKWTRANAELCLLATRGAPKRQAANVRQLMIAPMTGHSAKPPETHARIERLVSGLYLELFARRRRHGWDAWGNQVPDLEQLPLMAAEGGA